MLKKILLGMSALALVFVITSCASAAYTVVTEPIKPDAQNAVVYFFGWGSTKAQVWDGEKPVGTFNGGPTGGCMPWKTRAGAKTFVARSTNFATLKMNVQANKSYYVQIFQVGPVSTVLGIKELTKAEEEAYRKKWTVKDISYSDEWRKEFLAYDNGKWLKDLKEHQARTK